MLCEESAVKLCDVKLTMSMCLCVSVRLYCVCLCLDGKRDGKKEEGRRRKVTQEPHTSMWGKSLQQETSSVQKPSVDDPPCRSFLPRRPEPPSHRLPHSTCQGLFPQMRKGCKGDNDTLSDATARGCWVFVSRVSAQSFPLSESRFLKSHRTRHETKPQAMHLCRVPLVAPLKCGQLTDCHSNSGWSICYQLSSRNVSRVLRVSLRRTGTVDNWHANI